MVYQYNMEEKNICYSCFLALLLMLDNLSSYLDYECYMVIKSFYYPLFCRVHSFYSFHKWTIQNLPYFKTPQKLFIHYIKGVFSDYFDQILRITDHLSILRWHFFFTDISRTTHLPCLVNIRSFRTPPLRCTMYILNYILNSNFNVKVAKRLIILLFCKYIKNNCRTFFEFSSCLALFYKLDLS